MPDLHPSTVQAIARTLAQYRYLFADEVQLHAGIARVLDRHRFDYEREVKATDKDRFDFLLFGSLVIEAKVDGSLPAALLQVNRYCELPVVAGVVIAAVRNWTPSAVPKQLHGKPIALARLMPQAF